MKIILITKHRRGQDWIELKREDVTAAAHVTPKRVKVRLMTFDRASGAQIGADWRSFYRHYLEVKP